MNWNIGGSGVLFNNIRYVSVCACMPNVGHGKACHAMWQMLAMRKKACICVDVKDELSILVDWALACKKLTFVAVCLGEDA